MVERLRKPLLALVALAGFLGSITSEARGAEPCPYHDGFPAAEHSDSQPSAGHAGHKAQSSDDGATAHGASHSSEEGSHGCSCVGQCSTGASPSPLHASELSLDVEPSKPVVVAPSAEMFFSHKSGGL